MADKKKMSTADILAAARKKDGGGGEAADDAPAESPAAAESSAAPAEEKAAPQTPAKSATPAKPGERPAVSDILAMARAGKAGGAKAESAPKKPAEKPKPAAKPAAKAAKPAAGKAAAAGPKDTASILAAARSASKPGPMSKAEAAAKGMPSDAKAKPSAPPMPVKPAYAKPAAKKEVAEEERRSFLGVAAGVLFGSMFAIGNTAMAATAGLWTLSVARFMFPNVLAEPPTVFKVGFPTDFPPGSVATKFKAQYGLWIVNTDYKGTPEIIALKSVCTHLGCTPNWLEGEQKFKCPCHGSGYYKDGVNFEGPAPRPLERYAIHLASDGQLEVDKSMTFHEEKGEWSNPNSFVQA